MTIENLEIKKYIVKNILAIYSKINRFLEKRIRYNMIEDIKDIIDYPSTVDSDDEEYELLKSQAHLYHEILFMYLNALGVNFVRKFGDPGVSSVNIASYVSYINMTEFIESEFHTIAYMVDAKTDEVPEKVGIMYLPLPIYDEIQDILFGKKIFNRKPLLDSYIEIIMDNIKSLIKVKYSKFINIYFSVKDMDNNLIPYFELNACMYVNDFGKKVGQTKLHIDTTSLQPNSIYYSLNQACYQGVFNASKERVKIINYIGATMFSLYNHYISQDVLSTMGEMINEENIGVPVTVGINYSSHQIFITVQNSAIIDEPEDKETGN